MRSCHDANTGDVGLNTSMDYLGTKAISLKALNGLYKTITYQAV